MLPYTLFRNTGPSPSFASATGSVASKAAVLRASTSLAACWSRSAFRPVRMKDHLGPFCTGTTCRFESDASATADHNDGLPKELRFTVDGRGGSSSAHRSSDSNCHPHRDNTLALAVAVRHFVQVGLSELEAMSALAGPRLRAGNPEVIDSQFLVCRRSARKIRIHGYGVLRQRIVSC
jgi:hypothetical protein